PVSPIPCPEGLSEALRSDPLSTATNRMDLLAEFSSESAVRDLVPDMAALAKLPCRGILATALSDDEKYDFVSRFFAPAVGIPEDPVTGSAHCALAPYWAGKLGKTSLTGYQCSARGGTVRVTVRGDRVILGGNAVSVFSGRLLV
ncbi:MAG: PhzF family phenazine biosynthesis protein, partial [Methanoregulaceae archaeon]